ncbi:MAG: NgoMIV family type II restriction endonuclease [Mediterranea sp.]|jgi:hypothetical protein|nr:NgoMIV family type II restriction endonuclease [Mediterranea sp.]
MENSFHSIIEMARANYHKELLQSILTVDKEGFPSNADKHSSLSTRIAQGITDLLKTNIRPKEVGQTSGRKFEIINMQFLQQVFPHIEIFRPGEWCIQRLGNKNRTTISDFEQYAHLADLEELAQNNNVLAAALGNDYMVNPDIVISRSPLEDEDLNAHGTLVDDTFARKTMLRKTNGGSAILHASISSKWTIRSDRSQNSRTEALNLIRNRKGHLPHIIIVTAEPMPSRIASVALGTGDIDCVYHFALNELIQAVEQIGSEDSMEILHIMIDGKRLKDISDLPFDLIV